jgi:hypothetical protein
MIVDYYQKVFIVYIILEMFSYAKEYLQSHSWIIFDIDNNLVKTSQFDQQYNFGQLKRLRSDNIS